MPLFGVPITFGWVGDFIREAYKIRPEEGDAAVLPEAGDTAEVLAEQFTAEYNRIEATCKPGTNIATATLLHLHMNTIVVQNLWMIIETGSRIGSALMLRQYLDALQGLNGDDSVWRGWVFAVALFLLSASQTVHHQAYIIGFRMGLRCRMQLTAAIHAKVLRLNSACVADVSPGQIITLVSNDVRRFDDLCPNWFYLFWGPVELITVLVLIALVIGIVPALAGVSSMLLLIPIQSALMRYIGKVRTLTAIHTDERVKVASEAVQGNMAIKMLGWEDLFGNAIKKRRKSEAHYIARSVRIRAANSAITFVSLPVVSLCTFSVAWAMGTTFDVSTVFYIVALLGLPRLTVAQLLPMCIMNLAETLLTVAQLLPMCIMNLAETLGGTDGTGGEGQPYLENMSGSERPTSSSTQLSTSCLPGFHGNPTPKDSAATLTVMHTRPPNNGGLVALRGARYAWKSPLGTRPLSETAPLEGSESTLNPSQAGSLPGTHVLLSLDSTPVGQSPSRPPLAKDPPPEAVLPGSTGQAVLDCPLSLIDMEDLPPSLVNASASCGTQQLSLTMADLDHRAPLPLDPKPPLVLDEASRGILIVGTSSGIPPGAGQVVGGTSGVPSGEGQEEAAASSVSGKSSVLAALLGELQPLANIVPGQLLSQLGPLLQGTVAYCQQVPWVMSGTVRENITFGNPYDPDWYEQVIKACALRSDIGQFSAGDKTELGERGINLSGDGLKANDSGGDKADEELGDAEDVVKAAEVTGLRRGHVLKAFVEVATLIFIAEWGDRSMLATIALGAAQNPIGVAAGATVGHAVATGIAVIGGSMAAKYVSERTINIVSGVMFLIFAGSMAVKYVSERTINIVSGVMFLLFAMATAYNTL
eukprot:gene19162-25771_t